MIKELACPNTLKDHYMEFSHKTRDGFLWYDCNVCMESFLLEDSGSRVKEAVFLPEKSELIFDTTPGAYISSYDQNKPLDDETVLEIMDQLVDYVPLSALAKKYSTSKSAISRIKNMQSYKHLWGNQVERKTRVFSDKERAEAAIYGAQGGGRKKYGDDIEQEVRSFINQGNTKYAASKKFGIPQATIRSWYKRKAPIYAG